MRVQQLAQSARARAMDLKARAVQKYYSVMEPLVEAWFKEEIAQARTQARAREEQIFLAMKEGYREGLVYGYNRGLIDAKARTEAGEEIKLATRLILPEDEEKNE